MKRAIAILIPVLWLPSVALALVSSVYSPYSASSVPTMFNPSNPAGSLPNGYNSGFNQQAQQYQNAATGAAAASIPQLVFVPKAPSYQGGNVPGGLVNPFYTATCAHVAGPNVTVASQYIHCSLGGRCITSRACRFTDLYHAYYPYPINPSQPFVKPNPPDCYYVSTEVNVGRDDTL
jgi:hypothetical protein